MLRPWVSILASLVTSVSLTIAVSSAAFAQDADRISVDACPNEQWNTDEIFEYLAEWREGSRVLDGECISAINSILPREFFFILPFSVMYHWVQVEGYDQTDQFERWRRLFELGIASGLVEGGDNRRYAAYVRVLYFDVLPLNQFDIRNPYSIVLPDSRTEESQGLTAARCFLLLDDGISDVDGIIQSSSFSTCMTENNDER